MHARVTEISKSKFVEVRKGAKSIFDRVLLPELESLEEAIPAAEENLTGRRICDSFAKRRIDKMREQRGKLRAIKQALNNGLHPLEFNTALSDIEVLLFDAKSFESKSPKEERLSRNIAMLRDYIKFLASR